MSENLLELSLDQLVEPDKALRRAQRDDEKYAGLVDSIRRDGVITPITVRKDPASDKYIIIAGTQRYNASRDAGKTTIPAKVMTADEQKSLVLQIVENVQRIETKPVEYTKALVELTKMDPLLTPAELAARCGKTVSWLSERMGLLKLIPEAQLLVDDGKIGLSNAYALKNLPADEQKNFVDRAMTVSPQEFIPMVNSRLSELRKAAAQGKKASPEEFKPIPLIRSRSELIEEYEQHSVRDSLIRRLNITTPQAAFDLALSWVLSLDPDAAAEQLAKHEKREADRKAKKEANEKEREERKLLADIDAMKNKTEEEKNKLKAAVLAK